MEELTRGERKIFDFIVDYQRKYSFPPSFREICEAFGFKSNRTVQNYLSILERKGYITLHPGKKRSIRILVPLGIPVVGSIPAGSPIIPQQEFEEVLNIDPAFFTADPCFAVKVQGDSMTGAGIHHGDYAVIKQQSSAENGQVVAALIDEEITLKRFYQKGKRIELRPENPSYAPMVYEDNPPVILGVLVGIIRKY